MKEITEVGATPNRLAILYGTLADAGTKVYERALLARLMAPASLARTDAAEDNAFSDCVTAGLELGLFTQDGPMIRLAAERHTAFLPAVEARLIREPCSVRESDGTCAGAIAWMLCQDPLDPLPWKGSDGTARVRAQFDGTAHFALTSDLRYQQAVYWARALGFVERAPGQDDVVIPDPTVAVSRLITRVLPPGSRLPLGVFLHDLAERCPVLDLGRLRQEVEQMAGLQREANTISGSLALALTRLQSRRSIELHYLDDGTPWFFEGSPGVRWSHVSLPEVV